MARGIILSKKRRKVVILRDDGYFCSVRLKKNMSGMIVGQSVSDFHLVPRTSHSHKMSLIIVSVMVCIVLFLIGYHIRQNYVVTAYISFDLDPSIEASVNRHLNILAVDAMNDAAQKLVHDNDYVHMSLEQFTNKMLKGFSKVGHVEKNENIVISTTLAKPLKKAKREQLNRKIISDIGSLNKKTVSTHNIQGHFKIIHSTLADRNAAKKVGLTASKYLAYKVLMNEGYHHVTIAEAQELPIQDMPVQLLDNDAAEVSMKHR